MYPVPSKFSTLYQHGMKRKILSPATNERIDSVNTFCSSVFNVGVNQICWHNRIASAIQARFVAWYIVREIYGLSFPDIGTYYDRDHTTIMSGYKTIKKDPLAVRYLGDYKEVYAHLLPANSNSKFSNINK